MIIYISMYSFVFISFTFIIFTFVNIINVNINYLILYIEIYI
jgi:hypothetical protein